jgi:hypothetical protein
MLKGNEEDNGNGGEDVEKIRLKKEETRENNSEFPCNINEDKFSSHCEHRVMCLM